MLPVKKTGRHASATAIMTGRSKATSEGATASACGATSPERPSTPRMLNVLLPITLPTAISRSPRIVAMTEAATSGAEVPAATMVRPITSSETPSERAKAMAAVHEPARPGHEEGEPRGHERDLHGPVPVPGASRPDLRLDLRPRRPASSRRDCTTRKAV